MICEFSLVPGSNPGGPTNIISCFFNQLSCPLIPFCDNLRTSENKTATLQFSQYGPQVVWSNCVLASTAVELVVDLVTGWTGRHTSYAYFVYDGNESTVKESPMLRNFKVGE
jgi:hypothetical protein